MLKAIIFDFDGVILDTNGIKENAFFELFPEKFASIAHPVIKKSERQSRKIVIRNCVEEIEKETGTLPQGYDYYLDKYTDMTQNKVLDSPEIQGATAALDLLSKKYSLFVLTATPDAQIEEIIEARGYTQFTKVYGSDSGSKPEVARILLAENNLKSEEVIYIGDGWNNLACAKELEFVFIGIINHLNDFATNPRVLHKLEDLQKLPDLIEEISASHF